MRQAGIVAAAGIFALDHNVERLAEDHARARRLAEAWHAQGVPIELDRVQTNFVQIDVAGTRARRVGGDRRCSSERASACHARCGRACFAPSRTST